MLKRLRRIEERAVTLTERLAGAYPPAAEGTDELGQTRYRLWCERVARGDAARLEQRLRWDGYDPAQVVRALGALRIDAGRPLPDWLELLREVLAEAAATEGASDRVCIPAEPVPFEEVLLPFMRVARRRLGDRFGAAESLLGPSAWTDLERKLLLESASLAAPALFAEFAAHRAPAGGWADAFAAATGHVGRELYGGFVAGLLGGGLVSFFERYSVLARLLCTRVACWVDRTDELLRRIHSDRRELAEAFAAGRPIGRLARIQSDLSDSHRGWRTVCILEFECGLRVVYKPRSLTLEQAFNGLLLWLNERGATPSLHALQVLPKAGYGWVEFAEPGPCADAAAVVRYYERAGMLLCLVRHLGGSDFHHENVIARGEHPVLIDLEVLLGSHVQNEEKLEGAPAQGVSKLKWDSVLRTLLLPTEHVGIQGEVRVCGGLIAPDVQQRAQRFRWDRVNTDQMALLPGEREAGTPFTANLPRLDGAVARSEDYLPDLKRGFRNLYLLLMRYKHVLGGAEGPFARFATETVRVIVRPTHVYGSVLLRVTHPKFLQTGVEMGIELDVLSREMIGQCEHPPLLWCAFRHEREDLERLDFPLFTARADDTLLRSSENQVLGPYCHVSPIEGVRTRLHQTGRADLVRQQRFISLSFKSASVFKTVRREKAGSGSTLGLEEAVAEASSIAQAIELLAVPSRRGPRWYGVVQESHDVADLRDVGNSLHRGSAGIAVLEAALHAVTGDDRHRNAAIALLQPTLHDVASSRSLRARRDRLTWYGLGGAGGTTYALTVCAHLLRSAPLQAAALRMAERLDPRRPPQDRYFHVVSGSAGVVLALLALYRLNGAPTVLQQAVGWGRRLLAGRRTEPVSGLRAWSAPDGVFRGGFGKGAAGIAHALLELHRETHQTEFLDATLEAWAYVQSLRTPERDGWRIAAQIRPEDAHDASKMRRAWCLGSAGIGLARAAGLDLVSDAAARDDLDEAVGAVDVSPGLEVLANCCCGSAGAMELLVAAGDRLDRPVLHERAAELGAAIVRRAKRHGAYSTGYGAVYAPGFFKGFSGIGYQLLRLHHSRQLPSILTLQSPTA
jgi:type 2 lantibiotic biosynthesis protein LanM